MEKERNVSERGRKVDRMSDTEKVAKLETESRERRREELGKLEKGWTF